MRALDAIAVVVVAAPADETPAIGDADVLERNEIPFW